MVKKAENGSSRRVAELERPPGERDRVTGGLRVGNRGKGRPAGPLCLAGDDRHDRRGGVLRAVQRSGWSGSGQYSWSLGLRCANRDLNDRLQRSQPSPVAPDNAVV